MLGAVLGDARRAQLRAICALSMLGKQILTRRAEPRAQKICSPSMLRTKDENQSDQRLLEINQKI
uniref:Uncharacterized protein n=1 Tax=Romanomermis culicivorax TaxID=13658 RepID=A0A915J248_ROMCU